MVPLVTSVTVAVADFVGSAAEVAFTVTIVDAAIDRGAVYKPVEVIFPVGVLNDQVTALLLEPETVAVNCCV
jgi:hypothetical protein